MRTRPVAPWLLGVVLGLPAVAFGEPSLGAYHIVAAKRALSAGEQMEVRLEPTPPPGTYIYWGNAYASASPPHTEYARRAIFIAPFAIAPGTSSTEVRVALSGPETGRVSYSEQLALVPGAVSGAEQCLGPDQTFSQTNGAIVPEGQYVVASVGAAVHMADPEYPKSAAARGATGTIMVRTLVCRTGSVLAAYAVPTYNDRFEPIEADRTLAEAAQLIVRQRTFDPGLWHGEGRAAWIYVQVQFQP